MSLMLHPDVSGEANETPKAVEESVDPNALNQIAKLGEQAETKLNNVEEASARYLGGIKKELNNFFVGLKDLRKVADGVKAEVVLGAINLGMAVTVDLPNRVPSVKHFYNDVPDTPVDAAAAAAIIALAVVILPLGKSLLEYTKQRFGQ